MMKRRPIELLSPARDIECGLAAINAGADAVYIGGPKFGAREDAGNSYEDIARLVKYAHLFRSRVYITLNTILFDHELEDAEKMAKRMYEIGADALIIQDMALLEMNLPPIPLHASTQTNNYDIEKIRFLSEAGFSRIVLARELSLEEIKKVRSITTAELEFFVHGSLCVSLSGRCYLSYAVGKRSANRGSCAQPCRRKYTLTDKNGKEIAADKHLLSLKDLNLSDYIKEIADAGIDSFKIEGRLKDAGYVKNITAFYRKKIDSVLEKDEALYRPSAGSVILGFTPDPAKSFNRGTTDYFLHGRNKGITSFDSPKSLGEEIGKVKNVATGYFEIETGKVLSNNDGLAFINRKGDSIGIKVNRAEGNRVIPESLNGVFPGAIIYRNYDHKFNMLINTEVAERKLAVSVTMSPSPEGITIKAVSETGIESVLSVPTDLTPAKNREKSHETIVAQISKSGETPFEIKSVDAGSCEEYFFPSSFLNNIRRSVLDDLRLKLETSAKHFNEASETQPQYRNIKEGFEANISNSLSRRYYQKAGAEVIYPAPEVTGDVIGKRVMTTRHCLRYSFGMCRGNAGKNENPDDSVMYLIDGETRLRLEFNCKECFMNIIFEGTTKTNNNRKRDAKH
ncbi:MAG TPA: U32 family peptidase [Bacteroidales bacterium]|nr:U32 family peptidase [Bacteroidales bacterium]